MSRLVALTGVTGFLGLHLVAALARAGAKIRIFTRRDPAHEFWAGIEYETIYGDLSDAAALARLTDGADAVVHAAGLTSAPNRAAFLRVNRDGAAAVAQAARQSGAKFIFVSTLAARKPDISDYASSKHAGEEAVSAIFTGADSRLTTIRPPALYGPWDKAGLSVFQAAALPIIPILSRGRVSVLHITDAATALAQLAMGEGREGTFALPGGDYSLAEVMTTAASAQGRHGKPVHVPAFLLHTAGALSGRFGTNPVFSTGKARELLYPDWVVRAHEALPYTPAISLQDGFAETVAWYRAKNWLR